MLPFYCLLVFYLYQCDGANFGFNNIPVKNDKGFFIKINSLHKSLERGPASPPIDIPSKSKPSPMRSKESHKEFAFSFSNSVPRGILPVRSFNSFTQGESDDMDIYSGSTKSVIDESFRIFRMEDDEKSRKKNEKENISNSMPSDLYKQYFSQMTRRKFLPSATLNEPFLKSELFMPDQEETPENVDLGSSPSRATTKSSESSGQSPISTLTIETDSGEETEIEGTPISKNSFTPRSSLPPISLSPSIIGKPSHLTRSASNPSTIKIFTSNPSPREREIVKKNIVPKSNSCCGRLTGDCPNSPRASKSEKSLSSLTSSATIRKDLGLMPLKTDKGKNIKGLSSYLPDDFLDEMI